MQQHILPIVGTCFSGSANNNFIWAILDGTSYEGFFLSSPGIRKDGVVNLTIGAVYNQGKIDCGYAIMRDTKYQRPALLYFRHTDKGYYAI